MKSKIITEPKEFGTAAAGQVLSALQLPGPRQGEPPLEGTGAGCLDSGEETPQKRCLAHTLPLLERGQRPPLSAPVGQCILAAESLQEQTGLSIWHSADAEMAQGGLSGPIGAQTNHQASGCMLPPTPALLCSLTRTGERPQPFTWGPPRVASEHGFLLRLHFAQQEHSW